MVVVAVVGGTGNVGKTIVDALKIDGTHEVIVFGRKVPQGELSIPTFALDYKNIDQITQTLDEHKVHTVISTIVMYNPVAAQSERNLIAAATNSATVKRFVQSNWGDKTPDDVSLRIAPNIFREQSLEVLRKTDLEWTQIHNGLFLDYYGMPHVESYLSPLVIFVDIAHRKAAIPGTTGDEMINLTYTKDLAKFVVATLSLENWDEVMHVYSDQASVKQIIQLAEEATGDKFTITYDSAEKLRNGEITELPSHPYLYEFFPKPLLAEILSKFGLWAVTGIMYYPTKGSLNEKFPEIKTMSIKAIIGAWKGH
ncbi:NAD(P)-binding protein [Macroventuria anomochaeta]|uniref:NAD(P)-binding protein n=1 Tax=Macroventuria anomochaeta TaxID=301207 RepID=A0ACB6RX01_9PLEO|nr:NAD(P)-binding protein [Macroventuria anomochaeta]KAF2625417.1 NAD(P)-binding protein [Macroventuria anomochaeta]